MSGMSLAVSQNKLERFYQSFFLLVFCIWPELILTVSTSLWRFAQVLDWKSFARDKRSSFFGSMPVAKQVRKCFLTSPPALHRSDRLRHRRLHRHHLPQLLRAEARLRREHPVRNPEKYSIRGGENIIKHFLWVGVGKQPCRHPQTSVRLTCWVHAYMQWHKMPTLKNGCTP